MRLSLICSIVSLAGVFIGLLDNNFSATGWALCSAIWAVSYYVEESNL